MIHKRYAMFRRNSRCNVTYTFWELQSLAFMWNAIIGAYMDKKDSVQEKYPQILPHKAFLHPSLLDTHTSPSHTSHGSETS